MKLIKFFPITIIVVASCSNQNQHNQLTQRQMREDFEYTMQILYDCGATFHTKECVTGINPFDEARKVFEKNIDTVSTYLGFYEVMCRVLDCMRDLHTTIGEPHSFATHISNDIIEKNRDMEWEWGMGRLWGFDVRYIDGHYYCWNSPDILDDEKNIVDSIPVGTEILGMFGRDMQWLEQNTITPTGRWDKKDKRYILTGVLSKSYYGIYGKRTVQMRRVGSAEPEELDLTNRGVVFRGNGRYIGADTFKVDVFPNNMLYVRVPSMNSMGGKKLEPVIEKMAQLQGQNFKPNKAVVDIRGNGGGHDGTWYWLMSMLLPDTMKFVSQVVVPRTKTVADMFAMYPDMYPKMEEYMAFEHEFLPRNVEFAVLNDTLVLQPDSASLRYNGPIYLLVDDCIYSSAASFLTTINKMPNGISVGEPTGMYCGRGWTPFCFCMPNSQITFLVSPCADFTDVQQPEDLLHDRVKVEIVPSIAERAYECAYTGERYSYEYMSQHDTVFKYVMAQ